MVNSFKRLIVLGLLVAVVFACGKKGGGAGPDPVVPDPVVPDTTKPTITITKPTAAQIFVTGNFLLFQATFDDNVKLGSYSISITNSLPAGFTLKTAPTPVAWSYTKSSTNFSSGVKQEIISLSDISIPAMIGASPVLTGKYYFKITCIDAANNSTSTTLEITIN